MKLLLSYRDLRAIGIQYSRCHINRLVDKGVFPKPIRLGGGENTGKAYWRLADVKRFIEERAVASGHAPAAEITEAPPAEV